MNSIQITPNIKILEEKSYVPGSSGNERKYEQELKTLPGHFQHTTAYGIQKIDGKSEKYPIVLIGYGGASKLSEHSFVVHENIVFIAIDNFVAALDKNKLSVIWYTKIDTSVCFGLFWSEKVKSLISWGELEIARLNVEGEILWSVSGKDIFSEGFKIEAEFAFATDFEKNQYEINLETGKSRIIQSGL